MSKYDGSMKSGASKAERQQALAAPTNKSVATTKTDTTPKGKIEKKPDPNRGAATRARWSVILKSRPEGTKLLLPADIKVLSHDTVITSLVPSNPKKRTAADRYELYGFNGKEGVALTIAEFLKKLGQRHSHALALADIAWDVNHGFISLSVPEVKELPAEAEQVAEGDKPLDSGEQVAA